LASKPAPVKTPGLGGLLKGLKQQQPATTTTSPGKKESGLFGKMMGAIVKKTE
jgi:hypothetical protein